MTNTKITNRDRYEMLSALVTAAQEEGFEGYDYDMLQGFIAKQIAALDKKAAKAKETAAAKKTEKDELCEVVESLLTVVPQTREQITAQIEGDDVTVAKIGYRLSKLTALGVAVKEEISVAGEDGAKARRVMAYKLAN